MEFRPVLRSLVALLKPHTYVELGVLNGYTFNTISPLVKRAVAVDKNLLGGVTYLPNVEVMEMTTIEAARVFQGEIDILFIDANHEKSQVLEDFYNFSFFVKEGTGLILLHDTCPASKRLTAPKYCHNAWEAAWHIRQNHGNHFEIVTLPSHRVGLSVIRKSEKQLCINLP